jgi:hypothetical protein
VMRDEGCSTSLVSSKGSRRGSICAVQICLNRRRLSLLALVGAGLLLGVTLAPVALAGGQIGLVHRTQIVSVDPVGPAGPASGYQVASKQTHGRCPSPSVVAAGQTYHCEAGNGIYDPCWADPTVDHPSVLCLPYDPFKRALTRISLDSALPHAATNRRTDGAMVWALILANGDHCINIALTTGSIFHGDLINYSCSHGDYGVEDRIDRSGQPWIATAVAFTKHGHPYQASRVAVSAVIVGNSSEAVAASTVLPFTGLALPTVGLTGLALLAVALGVLLVLAGRRPRRIGPFESLSRSGPLPLYACGAE